MDIPEKLTLEKLQYARAAFEKHESRDLFYRVATELVGLSIQGKTQISVVEALAVLLQTWNANYYRFRGGFTSQDFDQLESRLKRHSSLVNELRYRHLKSMSVVEGPALVELFEDFEECLGPVGTAKALHLLAPGFFPLWDREIARRYSCPLGAAGHNGNIYFRFAELVKNQINQISETAINERNILKAVDEYNYCKYTKQWI